MNATLNSSGRDILLVADPATGGMARADLLVASGYHVRRAVTPEQALRLYAQAPELLVVVIDFGIPGLDGAGLIEQMREQDMTRGWVSYVLIGAGTLEQVAAAARLQVADILTAPMTEAGLVAAVHEALDLARAQKQREEQIRALHASLQDFRTRTYAALSQLEAHVRGSGAGVAQPQTGFAATGALAEERLAGLVQEERLRARLRERVTGDLGLGASGWILLLVLADARLAGCAVTIKSVAYDAGLPLSTALRKLNDMCAGGLVERHEDSEDARRSFVSLTAQGQACVLRYFSELTRMGDGAGVPMARMASA